jgi:putative transposase
MFIKENRIYYPMGMMCKLLKVSRAGYYKWLKCKTRDNKKDRMLLKAILYHYKKSNGVYGLPRLHAALRKSGLVVNKKRVARVMKANNIKSKTTRKFKSTTNRNSKHSFCENLLKGNFNAEKANQVWTSDITYLWTKEGWLYLAVIMDIYSRKIVGWSIGCYLSAELVLKAITMALVNRNPGRGVIFHSDRGSQYTSSVVKNMLSLYGFRQSMSSTGNCYDNAITETFFHTLKTEWIYQNKYQTREEAKKSVFQYIEIFYNRQRLHSSLNYLSPIEFELKTDSLVNEKVA